MLPKDIMVRSFHAALQCQSHSSNHCNLLLKRPEHQQRRVNTVESNSLIGDRRGRFPPFCPKRGLRMKKFRSQFSRKRGSRRWREFLSKNPSHQETQCLDSSHWIPSALVGQNFSGRNILKHDYKLKLNSLCTHVHLQLQQDKIFKTKENLKAGTMLKSLHLIKHCMNRIFTAQHQKQRSLSSCCNLKKRLTHGKKEKCGLRKYQAFLRKRGLEPLTIELKARCSAN